MEAISKLKDLAQKNNVSFEELCVYALGAAQQEDGSAAANDSEADGGEYIEEAPAEEFAAEEDDGEAAA